jgi:hypothetical protein
MHVSKRPARASSTSRTVVRSDSAIQEAARRYVADGEPLDAFLGDLEFAFHVLDLAPPSREVVKEASLAWADEILDTLASVACQNPLTGLSTLEHARDHVRALPRALTDYAVVVVSLLASDQPDARRDVLDEAFDQSLRLAVVGETIRSTFEGCDVVASRSQGRVLAIVRAHELLPERADELACQLRRRLPVRSAPRVLVEPLPPTEHLVLELLDDLAGRG